MSEQAQDTFVKERERLVSLAIRIVESRAIAEELVQDSWLRWSAKDYGTDKALPIFTQIVKNLAADWRRRKNVEDRIHITHASLKADAPDTEQIIIAREQVRKITTALQTLPNETVTAFRLNRFEGKSFEEVGKSLGVSKATAYRMVAAALVEITVHLN